MAAAKEANLKLTLSFEIDEETLREVFENFELKFTKKKIKELQEDLDQNFDSVQVDMEERFQEVVEEWIQNYFDE
jgi:transcriptional regulator of heat shock response